MSHWIKENFSFQDLQRITLRLIERVDVFAGFSQQELLQLLEATEKCTFNPGETILREGSTGAYLYVIIEGQVGILKSASDGQITELAKLAPGDSFGEMSLVDHGTRSASVVAREACVLLRMSEAECWRQAPIGVKIYRNIACILAHRLRDMDQAFILGHLPPTERKT